MVKVLNTKQRIVNAAIKNIASYGYDGATMKKIADDSEIKTASIYYFFNNKQALMLSVLDKVLQNHFSAMVDAYESSNNLSPLEIMQMMLERIAVHHFENSSERKVYLELLESSDETIKAEVVSYLERYNSWLYENLMNELNTLYLSETGAELKQVLDYFLLIGNGVFWATNLYSYEEIKSEVTNAKSLMSYAYNAVLVDQEE